MCSKCQQLQEFSSFLHIFVKPAENDGKTMSRPPCAHYDTDNCQLSVGLAAIIDLFNEICILNK